MKARGWMKLALFAGAILLPASAVNGEAKGAERPIQITIDGELLEADALPFIEGGTTFVPFRALFERLGLQVDWNASSRTVTGRGGVTIALQAGNPQATVDGELRQLAAAPVIKDGRTFVPLRFVGESAGATVEWNGMMRSITIVTGTPFGKEAEEVAVKAAYEAYVAAGNREDAAAIERLLHEQSPLRATVKFALADAFQLRDVETEIESLDIAELHADTASLLVQESNVKIKGAYYIDNRVEMKVSMRRSADGTWKLYDTATLSQEWLKPFGAANPDFTADDGDRMIAENTIASYMEALNGEQLQTALRFIHEDSPMRKSSEETLRWMFETYNLSHELETLRVLDRAGDEMYVYTVQAMRKKAGPKLADVRTETIHTLRKSAGGQWKLYSTITGKTETLSIPQ